MVRAKFKAEQITEHEDGSGSRHVRLCAAIHGPENEGWAKWTPNGTIEMTITNPAAYEQFKVGAEYFVDFTPAQ